MKALLFVPASNLRMLRKSSQIANIQSIADLEDSVSEDDYTSAYRNLAVSKEVNVDFLRIDPQKITKEEPHLELLSQHKRIVYPKICDRKSFDRLLEIQKKHSLEVILLVEHPWLLMNLPILFPEVEMFVKQIGFGSHDYAMAMGVSKDSPSVKWARLNLVNFAKSAGVKAIDIASMNIFDQEEFIEECREGKSYGYDEKFVIHPRQVEWLNAISFYTDAEILWAKKILQSIPEDESLIGVTVVDGEVIEKPHIARAQKIVTQIN